FRQDVIGSQRTLGVSRTTRLCVFLGVAPFAVETFARQTEIEGKLLAMPSSTKDESLHERRRHALAVLGHGHRDARRLPDRLRLAQDNLQYRAVDCAVLSEDRHRSNDRRLLAKPIDAP